MLVYYRSFTKHRYDCLKLLSVAITPLVEFSGSGSVGPGAMDDCGVVDVLSLYPPVCCVSDVGRLILAFCLTLPSAVRQGGIIFVGISPTVLFAVVRKLGGAVGFGI